MKRITISLPDDLARLVEQEARRRSVSVSEVIRRAVFNSLEGVIPREPGFAGICDDPDLPAAADSEATLEEGWGHDIDRRG